ncbi:MAG: hypothetical protein H6Q05_4468, partial [Acidobacteria bacterium]|nr:hypothetical protein [Acidobacteriota bacterium]
GAVRDTEKDQDCKNSSMNKKGIGHPSSREVGTAQDCCLE